jgi:NADH-quinone oxidoreductase subunit N
MSLHPLLEPHWFNAILPEVILCLAGMLLILADAFAPVLRGIMAPLAVIALIVTFGAESLVVGGTYFGGTYQIGPITRIFDMVFLLAALLATLFARDYLERQALEGGEFYALLLWATAGMMMMVKGLDLLLVILGLETLSICIFVLTGYHRRIAVSNEASLKYFLMGAFATGFILYGTALLYGASGSTNVEGLRKFFAATAPSNPLMTVAFVLLMAGFGFKLALVPFHAWAPDVYQGSPSPVAGWLSVAPKAATLFALVRIFNAVSPPPQQFSGMKLVAVLSVLSMIVGNAVAIAQRDLKRMLAYSGIAHVGYMTIAMLSIREDSVAAVAVYATTYALMNIGAFGVVSLLAKNQNDPQTLDDVAGLGFRRPFYGLALAVCMFSLSGLPPTAGFIAKFYIFKTAVESGYTSIALVGIITSIVSVFYYLRVVYYLYMKEATADTTTAAGGLFAAAGLAIAVIGIMVIGLYPRPLFDRAGAAARALLQVQ